jgi:arylsulfatase A-like enzyme
MKSILSIIIFFFFSSVLYAQSRPNIILILADDLGYGDLGCYGQQKIETPNIDKLSQQGLKFTQFYAGTAVCAPSRASLMLGLHTGHSPIRGNKSTDPEGQTPLPASSETFANLLQNAGYNTGAFGKWALGYITTSGDPQKKGFDEFYGYNCQTLAHNYYPDHLWHNHDKIDMRFNLEKDSVYSSDLIHQQAMNFLSAKHDKPFFLYLPYTLPHADVFVPHDSLYFYYVKKFNEEPSPLPKNTGKEKHHFDHYPHAAFAAMVSRLDRYVGEIMKLVKEKGMEENTLILFSSDNGPHKENGGDPVFFNSNGGLKGIKRDLYEGGIRVPFIAYQKGVTRAGTVSSRPCAFWDLYPTFLQMANIPLTKPVDGVSILPTLRGEDQKPSTYLYWEFHEEGGKQALRMGEWKAVKLNVNKDAHSPVELYNLASDPSEKNNVAAQYPAIVQQMESLIKEAHVPNKEWPLLPGEKK